MLDAGSREGAESMRTIRQLSPSVVNKIAAGEVIERPASVVKELLENAVDAGATRIDVSLEKGGGELIRVADNGCGIAADQLPLAVASHATSKIRDADDLFSVATLGFRGEALASIAEVSQFRLRSRTSDTGSGAEIEVVGGRAGEIAPCGCPVGTTVEVKNLFYNTPVRRKFLRAVQTEMAHITEAFTRVALARLLRQEPDLILADEPVSSLDPARAEEVMDLLCGVVAQGTRALVVSLHDFALAQRRCDRIVGLREGRIMFDLPASQVDGERATALYRIVG